MPVPSFYSSFSSIEVVGASSSILNLVADYLSLHHVLNHLDQQLALSRIPHGKPDYLDRFMEPFVCYYIVQAGNINYGSGLH